jgi:chromatin structure-remodeling complex protein RSC7
LLFKSIPSLRKGIAGLWEKEEIVALGITPYSYKSRSIATVAAWSVFWQVGARVIKNGRSVLDEYWEARAT